MVETYGLTHLALSVSDPVRSAQFYVDVFGCTVAWDNGEKIELHTPGRHDVLAFERATTGVGVAGGITHLGFRLVRPVDIDAAVDAIQEAGGSIDERGEFAPGFPFVFARDLDGYMVEVWFE